MKKLSYLNIQDWMYDLDLRLPEIVAYAVIFGFSQDDESDFHGGRAYLCRKMASTKPTVDKALQTLEERGLVVKSSRTINGKEYNTYKAVVPENQDAPSAPAAQDQAPAPAPRFKKETAVTGALVALHTYAPEFKDSLDVPVAVEALAKEPKWKGKTANAWKLAMQKLSRYAAGDERRAVAIIERTIERGWTGLFEIDDRDFFEWIRRNSPQSADFAPAGEPARPVYEKPRTAGISASEEIVRRAMEEFNA